MTRICIFVSKDVCVSTFCNLFRQIDRNKIYFLVFRDYKKHVNWFKRKGSIGSRIESN